MLHEEVFPFITNLEDIVFVKSREISLEVQDTSKPITSVCIIDWVKFLLKINTTRNFFSLDYILKRPLSFKTDIEILLDFTQNLDYGLITSYKTEEIFSPVLSNQLIMNYKLPQGFSSLSGETLVKGEPRPHTRIHLLSRDGTKLASTYSDAEGKYKFEGVREGESYISVAVDPLKEYTTISQDIKA